MGSAIISGRSTAIIPGIHNCPAVLWRRTSFGAQSQAGSVFVARMLTVVTTLHSQSQNVLEYLSQACQAAREGKSTPSLLPASSKCKG